MDADELCRTCLGVYSEMVPMFEDGRPCLLPSADDTVVNLLKTLQEIEISSHDGLPHQICNHCVDELQRCYTFKLKCRKSENTLLQLKDEKLLQLNSDKPKLGLIKPAATQIIIDEIIDIADDDSDDEDYIRKENDDEDVTFNDSYEQGVDMDEEMIENMTKFEVAEISSDDHASDPVTDFVRQDSEVEKLKNCYNLKKRTSKVTMTIKGHVLNDVEMKCPGCSAKFPKLDSLRQHIIDNHTESDICFLCDPATGNRTADIWKHSIEHLPKKYMCPACGKRFIKRTYVRAHIKLTHSGMRRDLFQCKLCSKAFKTRSGIDYHRQVSHCAEKQFGCEICARRFAHIKLLRLHMLSYHTDGPPKCKFCGQTFNSYSTMLKHVRRFHKGMKEGLVRSQENSFQCELCKDSFSEKDLLEAHVINIHTNFRQFKCLYCPITFKYKSVMTIHMKNQHPSGNFEMPDKCEICHKTIRSIRNFDSHMALVHSSTRPYLCVFCSYSFKIESNLEQHINTIHSNKTGTLEYKCDECEMLVYSRDDLLEHKRLSHDTSAAGYIFRTMFE